MTQGERVKEVRKTLGLTLDKFGEQIGLKKNSVSQIENGKNSLTDQVALSICREFNVNETWLRDGIGEMFIPVSKSDQIADMISDVLKSDEEDFKRRMISALARLDDKDWESLEHVIDLISVKK